MKQGILYEEAKRRNKRLFHTMLFKLIKKWEKIVVYEFNIQQKNGIE